MFASNGPWIRALVGLDLPVVRELFDHTLKLWPARGQGNPLSASRCLQIVIQVPLPHGSP